MSFDPISTYQEALHNFTDATRRVEACVNTIIDAAHKLQDWKSVCVSNTSIGFPARVASSGISINAMDWPTAEQLAQALASWHVTRSAVHNAWLMIPGDRRPGLQPPPD